MMLGSLVVLTASNRAGARGPAPEHIEAPTITDVVVVGLEVDLAWTWVDARPWDHVAFRVTTTAWDPAAGRFIGEDLVSEEGLADGASYEPGTLVQGSLSHPAPAAGLYAFRVEARAWNRPVTRPALGYGHEATFRAWRRQKVLVGRQGWSVVPLPGIRGDMLFDPRDPEFRFFYELYRGPSLVRDCGLDYLVGWPAAVRGHDCDWETGERALVLANPEPGAGGVWTLTFGWSGVDERFAEVHLEAAERRRG